MFVFELEMENLGKGGDCNPNCKIIVLDITCPSHIAMTSLLYSLTDSIAVKIYIKLVTFDEFMKT